MTYRYDYLMSQIEKAAQLIAALMSSKKIEHKQEAEINQTLAELTGFDFEFFANENKAPMLAQLLSMLHDDNQKAVVAKLLLLKNEELYRDMCKRLLEGVDSNKLSLKVREIT